MTKILEIRRWEALRYPTSRSGNAKISLDKQEKGHYLMQGVDNYWFYELKRDTRITTLKINDEIVTCDDPTHFIGMKLLAEQCIGKVLIGGLGLGMILHHLFDNRRVDKIDVLEINKNVIDLVKDFVPKDPRVSIMKGDVLHIEKLDRDYDTIVLDIWTPSCKTMSVFKTWVKFKMFYPDSNIMIWGSRSPEINPAVNMLPPGLIEDIEKGDI